MQESEQRANVLVGLGLEQVVLHHLKRELDDGSGVLDAPGRGIPPLLVQHLFHTVMPASAVAR